MYGEISSLPPAGYTACRPVACPRRTKARQETRRPRFRLRRKWFLDSENRACAWREMGRRRFDAIAAAWDGSSERIQSRPMERNELHLRVLGENRGLRSEGNIIPACAAARGIHVRALHRAVSRHAIAASVLSRAGVASRQTDAGITVQETINASINSALFLPQIMVSRPQVSIVCISHWLCKQGDLDHISLRRSRPERPPSPECFSFRAR